MIHVLYLVLTENCNSSCEYCYMGASRPVSRPELSKRAAKSFTKFALTNRASMKGRPQIRFVGGEPWMEPERLVNITNTFLLSIKDGLIVINSNGTLIKRKYLEPLQGEKRLIHVISLDGPKEVHDARRRLAQGSGYERAIKGFKLLKALNLKVVPNCVLDKQTLETLPQLMDLLIDDFGITELSLSLRYDPDRPLSLEDRYSALESAYAHADRRSIRLGGHHRLHLGAQIPELRCRAGLDTVLVNSDGTTNGCQRFIGRKPHDSEWDDGFDWADFETRQDREGVCGSCEDDALGKSLYGLYRNVYPDYSAISDLDRLLFGVVR